MGAKVTHSLSVQKKVKSSQEQTSKRAASNAMLLNKNEWFCVLREAYYIACFVFVFVLSGDKRGMKQCYVHP